MALVNKQVYFLASDLPAMSGGLPMPPPSPCHSSKNRPASIALHMDFRPPTTTTSPMARGAWLTACCRRLRLESPTRSERRGQLAACPAQGVPVSEERPIAGVLRFRRTTGNSLRSAAPVLLEGVPRGYSFRKASGPGVRGSR